MAATQASAGEAGAEPAARPGVLIVDDSSMMRSLLGKMLRDDGGWHLLGTAANGREAIEAARRLQPDICLLDLEMPVLGGLEALPALRAVCDAAVIVVSSVAAPGSSERRACLMRGAAAVVAKPSGAVSTDLAETRGGAVLAAMHAALRMPPDDPPPPVVEGRDSADGPESESGSAADDTLAFADVPTLEALL